MIRGALRRFLWFTVISAFAYGDGTTIAALCSYNSTIERKREKGKRKKKKKEKKRCVEVGRDLACLCISRHIRNHL